MRSGWHRALAGAALSLAGGAHAQPAAGWGVDACLSRHIPAAEVGNYVRLLESSGVTILRERDIGRRVSDAGETGEGKAMPASGGYEHDPRPVFRQLKAAGKTVVAFAGLPDGVKPTQVANALPEDLLTVFRQGKIMARDFAGVVDAWEMVGEPDVGYCTDLPDRVAAYQKALYLGIKAGSAEAEGGGRRTEGGGQASDNGRQPTAVSRRTSDISRQAAEPPLVLMGALALPPGPWLERAMRNGLLDYTDAYNFHFYGHAEDLAGVIAAHRVVAKRVSPDGRKQMEAGEPPSVLRPLSSVIRRLLSVFRPQFSALPLWITECGINAVPTDDYLNPARRELQADFTTKTAAQALAAPEVAVFMPFILVHEKDSHAMTLSATQPLPAWTAYAKFTREHPWPSRTLAAPPVAPNPVVLQWMPNNATTQAHKVSGSYRFYGNGPIQGELRIYNFSDRPARGRLRAAALHKLGVQLINPDSFELAPMSSRAIPVTFSRQNTAGYVYENWNADFIDDAGRKSSVAFALETAPVAEADHFAELPLDLVSVGPKGSAHRFDPGDEITIRGAVWQGVNGLNLQELPKRGGAESSLKIWVNDPRRDPMKARLAVARVPGGLPASGFLRVRLDRPMDREFVMCVDLVDRLGQRSSIWENMGVSYFDPKSKDVWLNLSDFAPYFWGRCTADPRLNPADIEEIQLRFYISKVNDPREISLAFMKQRESSK